MKFYLSSYKLGNKVSELKELIKLTNKKTAYISNALDFSDDKARREASEKGDIEELKELGLLPEIVDLRDYFNKKKELGEELSKFDVIWVRGGNVFVLRQAMRLSGFDEILKELKNKANILYGGYSAGVCVLGPTLKGIDIMDDVSLMPYGGKTDVIWDGLDIIDYSIIPHYKSNHPESESAERAVEYMRKNNIPFKTLQDGEVIIIE